MNNLNQIITLQKNGGGVYRVPEQARGQLQYIKPTEPPTAISAETKAGLAKAVLGLIAFAIAPQICLLSIGVYGAIILEGRRQQVAPKLKTEAGHKMPTNIRVGYQKQRKTTEVTQFTHIKTIEEYVS
jgi:hypothetical protein